MVLWLSTRDADPRFALNCPLLFVVWYLSRRHWLSGFSDRPLRLFRERQRILRASECGASGLDRNKIALVSTDHLILVALCMAVVLFSQISLNPLVLFLVRFGIDDHQHSHQSSKASERASLALCVYYASTLASSVIWIALSRLCCTLRSSKKSTVPLAMTISDKETRISIITNAANQENNEELEVTPLTLPHRLSADSTREMSRSFALQLPHTPAIRPPIESPNTSMKSMSALKPTADGSDVPPPPASNIIIDTNPTVIESSAIEAGNEASKTMVVNQPISTTMIDSRNSSFIRRRWLDIVNENGESRLIRTLLLCYAATLITMCVSTEFTTLLICCGCLGSFVPSLLVISSRVVVFDSSLLSKQNRIVHRAVNDSMMGIVVSSWLLWPLIIAYLSSLFAYWLPLFLFATILLLSLLVTSLCQCLWSGSSSSGIKKKKVVRLTPSMVHHSAVVHSRLPPDSRKLPRNVSVEHVPGLVSLKAQSSHPQTSSSDATGPTSETDERSQRDGHSIQSKLTPSVVGTPMLVVEEDPQTSETEHSLISQTHSMDWDSAVSSAVFGTQVSPLDWARTLSLPQKKSPLKNRLKEGGHSHHHNHPSVPRRSSLSVSSTTAVPSTTAGLKFAQPMEELSMVSESSLWRIAECRDQSLSQSVRRHQVMVSDDHHSTSALSVHVQPPLLTQMTTEEESEMLAAGEDTPLVTGINYSSDDDDKHSKHHGNHSGGLRKAANYMSVASNASSTYMSALDLGLDGSLKCGKLWCRVCYCDPSLCVFDNRLLSSGMAAFQSTHLVLCIQNLSVNVMFSMYLTWFPIVSEHIGQSLSTSMWQMSLSGLSLLLATFVFSEFLHAPLKSFSFGFILIVLELSIAVALYRVEQHAPVYWVWVLLPVYVGIAAWLQLAVHFRLNRLTPQGCLSFAHSQSQIFSLLAYALGPFTLGLFDSFSNVRSFRLLWLCQMAALLLYLACSVSLVVIQTCLHCCYSFS